MPARIRLRRMGRKKQPHYRIVVADSASPRDGRFVETLGYYKPLTSPARLVLNMERVDHWLSEGASPSGTVKSLISKARVGGDAKVAVGELNPEDHKAKRAEELAARRTAEKKAEAEAEAAAAEAAAAEAAEAEAEKAAAAEEEGGEAEAAEGEAEEAAAAEAEGEVTEGEAEVEAEAEAAPEAQAEETPEASDAPEADAADDAVAEDEEKSE